MGKARLLRIVLAPCLALACADEKCLWAGSGINTDMNATRALTDLRVALALLTRLPLQHPPFDPDATRPMAHAAWAYPLAGLVVGLLASTLGWTLHEGLNLPAGIAAALMLLSLIMLTGAMHEDGLADCADGFWGGWEPARRLEIMKDSQIGSYGTIALVLSLLLRWYCLTHLLGFGWIVWPMVVTAVASRAAVVVVMQALPNARAGGLSDATGKPGKTAMGIALVLAAVTLFSMPWSSAIALIAIITIFTILGAVLAKQKIGGQTGDVLGGIQQVAEIAILITFVGFITS